MFDLMLGDEITRFAREKQFRGFSNFSKWLYNKHLNANEHCDLIRKIPKIPFISNIFSCDKPSHSHSSMVQLVISQKVLMPEMFCEIKDFVYKFFTLTYVNQFK
jgi:hypothetical protein